MATRRLGGPAATAATAADRAAAIATSVVEQLKIVETLDSKQLDEILAREDEPSVAASSGASAS